MLWQLCVHMGDAYVSGTHTQKRFLHGRRERNPSARHCKANFYKSQHNSIARHHTSDTRNIRTRKSRCSCVTLIPFSVRRMALYCGSVYTRTRGKMIMNTYTQRVYKNCLYGMAGKQRLNWCNNNNKIIIPADTTMSSCGIKRCVSER